MRLGVQTSVQVPNGADELVQSQADGKMSARVSNVDDYMSAKVHTGAVYSQDDEKLKN